MYYLCINMNHITYLKQHKKARIAELNQQLEQGRAEAKAHYVSFKITNDHPKYFTYLNRAKDKKLDFELSGLQFNELMSQPCTYCGGNGGSIDRIDSGQGYTIDNTCPCCWPCNRMKYTGSVQHMMDHALRIVLHNKLN